MRIKYLREQGYDLYGTRHWAVRFICYLVFSLLLVPIVVVIIASFNPQPYLSFSLKEFSLTWYLQFFEDFRWRHSLWLSLYVALLTVCVTIPLGTMAALAMVRVPFRGKGIFQFLVLAPFLIPGLVLGIGLLIFMNIIQIRGSIASLVAGHSILTLPLAFLTIRSVLVGLNPAVEEASVGLGASHIRTFLEITLPLIKPGLLAASFFVFIFSFNEFIVSLFLTTHRTMTLPIRVWTSLKYEISPIVAATSTILILVSVVTLAMASRLLSLERLSRRGQIQGKEREM
jgi:ABC-type spermidine/putrescine transport system permease subunit II